MLHCQNGRLSIIAQAFEIWKTNNNLQIKPLDAPLFTIHNDNITKQVYSLSCRAKVYFVNLKPFWAIFERGYHWNEKVGRIGTAGAGCSLFPLFLPKWHLTHKSFMLLIVQRCPWPAIPQPPLFTKFLRPGRIDYRGHVIHIESVCVPELIITTLAVLTQTAALCIACPSAPQALQAERIWAKTGHVRDYEILPSRDLEKTWEKSSHVIGKLLLV